MRSMTNETNENKEAAGCTKCRRLGKQNAELRDLVAGFCAVLECSSTRLLRQMQEELARIGPRQGGSA